MSAEGRRWLGRRVRVGAASVPGVTLAEGVVVAYSPQPTVMVRDERGRDSCWQVSLPITDLGEASQEEMRSLSRKAQALRGSVDTETEGSNWERSWATLDEILIAAGIEWPLRLAGVRDLVNQRDGQRERAEEAEQLRGLAVEEQMQAARALALAVVEKAEMREQLARAEAERDALLAQRGTDQREQGRSLDAVQRKLTEAEQDRVNVLEANSRQAQKIHELESKLRTANGALEVANFAGLENARRLANVREMVRRLRNASGEVSAGYAMVRIQDMLNGEEPT